MNTIRFSSLFLGILLVASSCFSMDRGKERAPDVLQARADVSSDVVVADLDDVTSIKHKIGAMDFIGMVRALFWNPWIMTVFANFNAIQTEGARIGNQINGATNVVHAMIQLLKDQGYGDLSYYEDEIVGRSTKPEPNRAVIDILYALKNRGYTVIAATNQDYNQHMAYRVKMAEQGVDLNDLFDGVVTTRVHHEQSSVAAQGVGFYWPVTNENIYTATEVNAYKPHPGYYDVVKRVATYINRVKRGSAVRRIIFIDDNKANSDAAQTAGLHAIHFDLPEGKSARKATPQELRATVDRLKQRLKAAHLNID